jgi:hypothetical protein
VWSRSEPRVALGTKRQRSAILSDCEESQGIAVLMVVVGDWLALGAKETRVVTQELTRFARRSEGPDDAKRRDSIAALTGTDLAWSPRH